MPDFMELILTNKARQAIAEARSVDEVKGIRDRAAAIRMYAKQAGLGKEMQNDAAEIQLRAERRAGEMLAVMDKNTGSMGIGKKVLSADTTPLLTAKLDEMGVTRDQSSQWQQMASVPEAEFEKYLAENRDAKQGVTTSGALRVLLPETDGKHKPKENRAGDIDESKGYDSCQTPAHAIVPLLSHIQKGWTIWESASGEGNIVKAFKKLGVKTVGTDILTGNNFFEYRPDKWDCQITNPPYSIKYQWLERSYKLDKPFALLLPVETLGARKAQLLFIKYGLEVMFLDKRINFKMPNKGWEGSAAQFPVAWFTWGMNLPAQIVFATLPSETN